MLITDYNLLLARERAERSILGYKNAIEGESACILRLRVSLEAGDLLPPGKDVGASLFVMGVDQSTSPKADDDVALMNSTGKAAVRSVSPDVIASVINGSLGPPADEEGGSAIDIGEADRGIVELGEDATQMDRWREVENLYFPSFGQEFNTFPTHKFTYGTPCQVRVEFFIVDSIPHADGLAIDEQLEVHLGYAGTTLQKILDSPNEIAEVDLVSMDHSRTVGRARFGVEIMRDDSTVLALDVRMRVNKKEGWPFSSSRLFFVVYRKEYDGQWTPLYRSEVRVKNTDHPDIKGCMLFAVAEVNEFAATGGSNSGVIRIEFFQYKTSRKQHKLLGYLMTTVQQLRQTAPGGDLGMKVNAFTNVELVGKVQLQQSLLTVDHSYFSILADFGGPVEGNFVFVDMCLSYTKGFFRSQPGVPGRSVLSSNRPYYQLNRVDEGDGLEWGEVVYRSVNSVKHPGTRLLKFQLAKVNIAKLTGGDMNRPLCISFHSGRGGRIGRVKTSLGSLMNMPPGSVLDITFRTLPYQGFVLLERKEWTANNAYLALKCVLGEEFHESGSSASDNESEVVEIPFGSDSSSSRAEVTMSSSSTPLTTPVDTPGIGTS